MLLTWVQELPDKTNGQFLGARREDLPWGLVVMDYIQGTRLYDLFIHRQDPSYQDVLASRIATMLVTLSSHQAPQGTCPGPGDGDSLSCLVWGFDEFEAPQGFETKEELQEYINKQIEVSDCREV